MAPREEAAGEVARRKERSVRPRKGNLRDVAPRFKRFLVFAVCVLVAWYAHRPLLGAGFLGADAAVLDDLNRAFREGGASAPWDVAAVEHRPIAAASLALSSSIHAKNGVYTPGDAGRLRLESLLLLVIAAFGVRSAVIRALKPWTGEDHARSAGAASGAFLMMHPLLVPVVAHLPARGDAVALATSAWSIALLLKGRQDRRAVAFGSAFVLAVIAAASSPVALLLIPLGFGLEFVASRRHRPFRARMKTALQVATGYAAALGLEWVVRMGMMPSGAADPSRVAQTGFDPSAVLAQTEGGLPRALGFAAEKIGVVVLPVNTTGVGTIGYVLAVVALLAALHPGFVAARAAPRLWGRVLGGWAIALACLLVLGSRVRTIPASLSDAPDTLALALTMAVGLGISATALSGAKRTILPALTGGLYAILTAGSGATIKWAAAEVGALHEIILESAREDGWARPTWVLDPPRMIAGVTALRPEHERSLTSAPFRPVDAPPVQVRGIPSSTFWALATEPAFQSARQSTGVTLLLSPVPNEDGGPGPSQRYDALLEREVLRIDPALPSHSLGAEGRFGWVADGAAPAGRRFDAFDVVAATAEPPLDLTAAEWGQAPPKIRWLGKATPDTGGAADGAWVKGVDGPVAVFWLGDEPAWILSGVIRSLWFAGVLGQARTVSVARTPRALPESVAPRTVGENWTFDIADVALLEPLDPSAEDAWSLWVIDPVTGGYARMALTGAATGRLVAEGAARFRDRSVLWVLNRTIDGVVTERARGRRVPVVDE